MTVVLKEKRKKLELKKVKFGELITILTDYHANGSYQKLKKNVVLLDSPNYAVMIRTTNFEKNDFSSGLKYITEHAYNFLGKSKVFPNDILMNKIANAGSVYLMPDIGKPVSLAMNLFLIRTNPLTCNQKYVYYYLKNNEAYIKQYSNGTAAKTITKEAVRNLELRLPPIENQDKIVSALSANDDLIENNLRRIEILEEMAQSIYREWFVHFRYPGNENVPMVDSDLGPIPEGWEVKSLGELVTTQYGYTESASKERVGPKYLRGMDINKQSYINWSSVPYCPINEENYRKYKLSKGDILVIRMADPGKVGIVESNVDAVFASYLIRLSIKKNELTPYFLFYFLSSKKYQNYITGVSTGTTRKSASSKVVTGISLVIPSKKVLRYFEEELLKVRTLITSLINKNENLQKSRDLLLPRLISGQLDVSDLEVM